MVLRILHVSDIHFHKDAYGWDPNLDQRGELVRDLAARVASGGQVDAVLVGGDIAFGGHPDEYATAEEWLTTLVAACGGIGKDRVWTVPGNHDVDRNVLRASMPAQVFREQLRDLPSANYVDEYLRKRVTADPTAEAYFEPLRAYNEFARPYMCHSEPPKPHWVEDSTLFLDGQPVHITGLNSSLNSDDQDDDFRDADGRRQLALGLLQCQLSRENNPVHIVIAHHPPNWIRDWEVVAPYLRRGHVWIFGHEHRYMSSQEVDRGSLQLSGGAVGPERRADGEKDPYVPAYLLLTLSFNADGDLAIHVEPRYWSMSETRFIEHPDGAQDFVVGRTPAVPKADATGVAPTVPPAAEPQPIAAASASPIGDAATSDLAPGPSPTAEINRRELARQFGALPPTKRLAIGLALEVLDETDLAPGAHKDLARLILRRVGERGLVDQLQAKVTA
ncbi:MULTISPECIES: metallophosphoesterase family protein [unclassified Nocardioides]|uniref:metallophosphoesterase family protein n=1 Tax=unclassified Nocardioides TaxID=2615069 RepID=UPI003014DA00